MDQNAILKMLETQKPMILKESKRVFNSSLITLFRNLRIVFPDDSALATIEDEVKKKTKAKETSDLLLVSFAKKINESSSESDGPDIGALILRKDERVLLDPAASIPVLQKIKIQDKWPKLSPDNQAVVWDLMIKLVESSMQYMVLLAASPADMIKISMGVLQGTGGKPDADAAEATRRVQITMEEKLKEKKF